MTLTGHWWCQPEGRRRGRPRKRTVAFLKGALFPVLARSFEALRRDGRWGAFGFPRKELTIESTPRLGTTVVVRPTPPVVGPESRGKGACYKTVGHTTSARPEGRSETTAERVIFAVSSWPRHLKDSSPHIKCRSTFAAQMQCCGHGLDVLPASVFDAMHVRTERGF